MASVARYCCCGGCPDNIKVTVSGVDAAACVGCNTDGVSISWDVNSLDFDGVYTASKTFEDQNVCIWLAFLSVSINDWDDHFGTTCSSLIAGGADNQLVINVIYSKSTGAFSIVNIAGNSFSKANSGYGFYATSGGFGSAISNSLTCATSGISGNNVALSNGGTVLIERA